MNWNLEGSQVAGRYIGVFLCSGKVLGSRVKYGGKVEHDVELDRPIEVFGSVRTRVNLDHEQLMYVDGQYVA